MPIAVIGLNHKTAPVEIREKLVISNWQIKNRADEIHGLEGISGMVMLSTCNRTEIYFTADQPHAGVENVARWWTALGRYVMEDINQHFYVYKAESAILHLFKVTSGMDSMILGESQIQGQVETAYEYAREYKLSNNILNTLFQRAIATGKRVRTETRLDRGIISVGSVAVELAKRHLEDLHGCTILVLGAGDTSELVVQHLVSHGASVVVVSNRTYDKAVKLAEVFDGKAIHLHDFPNFLPQTDIVISCTSAPRYILGVEQLLPFMEKETTKQLLLIDIAVPRDIDPRVADIPGIVLYNVDDLQEVVSNNLSFRKKEILKAEQVLAEEMNKFLEWLRCLEVVPVIVALNERAESIKVVEMEKTWGRLSALSEKEKKVIAALVDSILNRFLGEPITKLKDAAINDQGAVYGAVLQELFNLKLGEKAINRAGNQ
ncbi:MAG: glutamyl-tRNA reductase [Desulfitobacteriaceae bacterium]|nr:glutamyl-tRNA reductase [Clostridia bacterium]MDD4345482.1 glutamyl-tRNA reductase [Desulfitobacteriaceae bacterium]MDD4400627.1 glutamyl-tRNA reductase [Desulfitobacteriaceae bacterium]